MVNLQCSIWLVMAFMIIVITCYVLSVSILFPTLTPYELLILHKSKSYLSIIISLIYYKHIRLSECFSLISCRRCYIQTRSFPLMYLLNSPNLLNSLRVIQVLSVIVLFLSQWKSYFSLMIFHMAPRGRQTKVTTQIRETSLTRITSTMENVLILLCLYRRKARHAGRHMFPHTRTIL